LWPKIDGHNPGTYLFKLEKLEANCIYEKEFTMSIPEVLDSLKKTVPSVALSLVMVLVTWGVFGATTEATVAEMVDAKIDARVGNTVGPQLFAINAKLDMLVESIYTEQIRQIEKTAEAIYKDPGDVKATNVKEILRKWKSFPETMKTDDLIAKYGLIVKWYDTNVVKG